MPLSNNSSQYEEEEEEGQLPSSPSSIFLPAGGGNSEAPSATASGQFTNFADVFKLNQNAAQTGANQLASNAESQINDANNKLKGTNLADAAQSYAKAKDSINSLSSYEGIQGQLQKQNPGLSQDASRFDAALFGLAGQDQFKGLNSKLGSFSEFKMPAAEAPSVNTPNAPTIAPPKQQFRPISWSNNRMDDLSYDIHDSKGRAKQDTIGSRYMTTQPYNPEHDWARRRRRGTFDEFGV